MRIFRMTMLAASLLAAACASTAVGPAATEIPLDVKTAMSVGESRLIATTGVRLTFEAVPEYSLCPGPPIVCVWAGRASARFALSAATADTTVMFLLPAPAPPTAEWRGLMLSLEKLESVTDTARPGPQSVPTYRATVLVRRN